MLNRAIMHYARKKGIESRFWRNHGYTMDRGEEGKELAQELKKQGLRGEDLKREIAYRINHTEKPNYRKGFMQTVLGDDVYFGLRLYLNRSRD